jgi:hypothetical protein
MTTFIRIIVPRFKSTNTSETCYGGTLVNFGTKLLKNLTLFLNLYIVKEFKGIK